MSRFSFSTIISLPEENDSDFEDLLGYSLYSWELHGVVGFDISLNTYFMNMEGSWIFGTDRNEISTIAHLQRVIAAIFRGAVIPFCADGLHQITVGVEKNPAILSPEQAAEESSQISSEYIDYQLETANYYRSQ